MKLLRVLQKMGTAIKAVDLLAKDRVDSGPNNAVIMEQLIKDDRDFFSPDEEMVREIDKVMVEIIEKELVKQTLKKAQTGKSDKTIANAIAAKAFLAAMEKAKEFMRNRIELQTTVGGGAPAELSEQYERYKERKFGFTTIGKATGQLLDNLASGSRNTKLRR